jgi:hypothetical protein
MNVTNNVGPQNSAVLPSRQGTSTYEHFLPKRSCFMLVSYLIYSSTLKMDATRYSGKSAGFHRTTECYILENRTPFLSCSCYPHHSFVSINSLTQFLFCFVELHIVFCNIKGFSDIWFVRWASCKIGIIQDRHRPHCLRPLERWDRGFESHSRHGCLCLFCVCIGSGLTTGWSPIQGVLPTVLVLRHWSETKAFHGCPMLHSGDNRKER